MLHKLSSLVLLLAATECAGIALACTSDEECQAHNHPTCGPLVVGAKQRMCTGGLTRMPTGMPQPPIPDVVTMTGMPQPPIPDVVECACTGNMGKGAMQDDYPQDIGNTCSAWDSGMDYCLEGGSSYGEDWCPSAWCYAPEICVGSAKDSYLSDYEGPDLYYNYDLCGAEDTYTGTDSDPLAEDDEDDEDDEDEDEPEAVMYAVGPDTYSDPLAGEALVGPGTHSPPCVLCRRRILFATQPTPGGLPCC